MTNTAFQSRRHGHASMIAKLPYAI